MAFKKSIMSKGGSAGKGPSIDTGKLNHMIKERAYYLWQEKGRPNGRDHEIWLQAEREIVARVKK